MYVTVVMRSYNDADVIAQTLDALFNQTIPFDLLVLDNESDDGTREIVAGYTDNIVNIPRGSYIPGKVLNEGMRRSSSDIVVFLNSDCTPAADDWLEKLLLPFEKETVAAVFGAQLPREDCHPIHARDINDTFGVRNRQSQWNHCFSMASSAIRRRVWRWTPFSESLQYSEDIDWTWKARRKGYYIQYAPESQVFHSHNYTLKQCFNRHYGEGHAEASIFNWSQWNRHFLRYALLPFFKRTFHDCVYLTRTANFRYLFSAPLIRAAQLSGRWQGFRHGLKEMTTC